MRKKSHITSGIQFTDIWLTFHVNHKRSHDLKVVHGTINTSGQGRWLVAMVTYQVIVVDRKVSVGVHVVVLVWDIDIDDLDRNWLRIGVCWDFVWNEAAITEKVKKLTYGSTVVSTFILYISTWILMIHYYCIQIKGKVGGKHSLLIILIFLMH